MPGMVCKNSDLEFDLLKPCFYLEEDDIYFGGHNSTPPGEDTWKKFELLLTPQLSPGCALAEHSLEPVNRTTEMLLPEVDLWSNPAEEEVLGLGGLRSCTSNTIILQDCTREKPESVVSEKLPGSYESLALGTGTLAPRAADATATASCAVWALSETAGMGCGKAAWLTEVSHLDSDYVDPAVVFFPANKHEPMPVPTIPTSTGEASNSGSVEEGGKEIYVDMLEETQFSENVTRLPTAAHWENAAPSLGCTQSRELILKHCDLIQEQHNYAAPPLPYLDREDPRPQKKPRSLASLGPLKRVLWPKTLRLGSQNNSDLEDVEHHRNHNRTERQRRNHNRTERQRRGIMRSGFLNLRDLVPELAHDEKAAKVVILKKATEYIHTLQADEFKLLVERKKLYKRQQQLLEKIRQSAVC